VAGGLCQPVGQRPENPDVMHNSGRDTWEPEGATATFITLTLP
jgi:hypothetical protein